MQHHITQPQSAQRITVFMEYETRLLLIM